MKERLSGLSESDVKADADATTTVSSTRTSKVKSLYNQLSPMISLTATSGTRTKNASNTVTCHDYFIKKWVLVTAHIAAIFNYNPSKGTCTAHRIPNYMKLGSFTPVLSVINTHLASPACPTGRHHRLLRDRLLLCQVPGNQTDPLSPQDQARGRSQAELRPRRLDGLDNFCRERLTSGYRYYIMIKK